VKANFSRMKRRPEVPRRAARMAGLCSKADFLEAAYHLASLAHDGGCDDVDGSCVRLLEELNLVRQRAGRSPVKETP